MSESSPRDTRSTCWVLVGPTASGKSAVAEAISGRRPVEILSVDSMQVYRGMDIGTAKPSEEVLRTTPYHMIDVLEPEERFNVARYCEMATFCLEDIWRRGKRPFLVCGTPLYLKGLLWGLFEGPGADPEFRRRLRRTANEKGSEALHRRLQEVDPAAAERIEPTDVKRLVRALEVYELTGEPISEQQQEFEGPAEIPHVMVGLRWPRQELYRRIERRVDRMLEAGLVEEVRAMSDRLGPQAGQAVGYKEFQQYLAGNCSLQEAVEEIKKNTRHLAKSQLTWFRRLAVDDWIEVQGERETEELARCCERRFAQLEESKLLSYD